MKKTLMTILMIHSLYAQTITLSPQQEKNWQITTQNPIVSSTLPIGEFSAEVITPPSHIQTVALPFEVHTKQLFVSQYDNVTKGQLLAEVSAMAWLEAQQNAVDDYLALENSRQKNERNRVLCNDGILPQKTCLESETEFKQLQAKYNATVALLQNYGASDDVINNLFKTLKISPTLKIFASDDATIASSNTSATSSEALFVLHKNGTLWLESAIETVYAKYLNKGENVHIAFNGAMFDAKILQRASIIDSQTQTQTVRFEIPANISISSGIRANAEISLSIPTLKVPKLSVITLDNQTIVYTKTAQGYIAQNVEILGEDTANYYLKDDKTLHHPIAVTSLAILKNLSGGEDE